MIGSRCSKSVSSEPGASQLRKRRYQVGRRIRDRIDNEREAGRRFVEHRVAISDFIVKLELAARARGDIGILQRSDVVEVSPKRTGQGNMCANSAFPISGSRP